MTTHNSNILIVDDEPLTRELLNEYLIDTGYNTVQAADGAEAWELLQQPNSQFDAVILDRNMPNMNGLEVLKKIKAHPDLNKVPVIMQTGAGGKQDVLEGLQAGSYYYLTKPFEKDVLLSIVKAAIEDYCNYRSLQESLQKQNQSLVLLNYGCFSFRDLNEARLLTTLIAAACPESDSVAMGLSELLINAVEHGNLNISYAEKSQLLSEQQWEQEIERRLTQEKYSSHYVSVVFERKEEEISIVITDQGEGFEWQQYLAISPERSLDPHGRGIAMANMLSFSSIEYQGKGNIVKATIKTTN